MNKKIKICACDIFFDYEMNRFFLITARGVKAFDLATNQRIASFSDVANPNQVAFSKKHNLMIIKSTGGNFAVYKRDDFTFLGKVKLRGCSNTDAEFIYDGEENALYGIMTVGLENQLYRVLPKDLKYETFKFPKEIEGFEEFKKVSAHYRLHRYKDGGFYILRNVRGENDLKGKRSGECLGEAGTLKKVMSLLGKNLLTASKRMDSEDIERADTEKLIDEVFEGVLPILEEAENNIYIDKDNSNESSFREYSYGIYRLENGTPILKEKLMTSSKLMTLDDIDYPNAAKEIKEFCGKSSGYFRKIYKSRNKLFFVTSEGIYEKTDKQIKEVYNDEYMSDFAEYNGKQYICTWEYCLIRDIPEEE